jgi:hypothetical protein
MKEYNLFDKSAQDKFEEYHAQNPQVLKALIRLTDQAVANGHKRLGIELIYNVLRWETMISTMGDEYKLNNNYKSRYARLIEEVRPDLEGIFNKRGLRS